MKRLFLSTTLSVALLYSQTVPDGLVFGGSIDGVPIPQRVFEASRLASEAHLFRSSGTPVAESDLQADLTRSVCSNIRGSIQQAARSDAERDLSIAVSPEEINAARAEMPRVDPVEYSRRMAERAAPVLSALAAVYDSGADRHQTWVQMLQPKGIDEQAWIVYLGQSATPEGRQRLTQRLVMSPDAISHAVASSNLQPMVAGRKLNEAIDRLIAQKDAKFASLLEREKAAASNPDPRRHWMPVEEKKYLDTRRSEWWKSRVSKMSVILRDATLPGRCNLAELGVVITVTP